MIVSASRRTDIPCCYGDWMLNRLRAGSVLIRNPRNSAQLSRFPLSPETTDCIVFWTKDPQPFLPKLREIEQMGHRFCFQFTLTPYGKTLEPHLREKAEIERTLVRLSEQLGRDRVFWRYDPIIFGGELTPAYHAAQFERLCRQLASYTASVTVSFLDVYPKLRHPFLRAPSAAEIAETAARIGEIAAGYGLPVKACCESGELSQYGIRAVGCLDAASLETVCGSRLKLVRDTGQRAGCLCCRSVDIGAYDTCTNDCVYCYANDGTGRAKRRFAAHDPDSELLTGCPVSETIVLRQPTSDRIADDGQLNLFESERKFL